MTDTGVNLKFSDAQVERVFQVHYDEAFRPYFRFGVGVGTILFAFFGVLDRLLFPEVAERLWWWRYLFCMPPLVVTLGLLFVLRSHRWVQPVLSLVASLVGLGTLGMIHEIPTTSYNAYYAGLMLVIFYAHAFVRLRFLWATLASLVIFAGYEVLVFLLRPETPVREVISGHFFLVSTILAGMGASYSLELDARKQFLLQRNLDGERLQLEAANRRLVELNRQLEALARVDDLTGIANRRAFMEELEREWRAQIRQGRRARPLSLLMIDIDHFKDYNDLHGHPAGDRCLRRVAGIIAGFARRPRDLSARIGGEEFVLLLPEIEEEQAVRLAEQLRAAVMERAIAHGASGVAETVTVSIGAATLVPAADLEPGALLRQADRALYLAKREGRNRVMKAG